MDQNDQDVISEEDNNSFRDSDGNSDEDSVDIISTDYGDEDFEKRSCSETNINKNKFSIENILGLNRKDVQCDEGKTDSYVESDICSTENVRKVKCVKPTPISAAARSTG